MIDKNYCCASYLAFRYVLDDNKNFKDGLHHQVFRQIEDDKKCLVETAADIDVFLQKQFNKLKDKKLGILLSGGMDSAILASYMKGQVAYTFRFLGGEYQKDELQRAELFAKKYDLELHYVDINWETIEKNLFEIFKHKHAPCHSIEPQIVAAAKQAKEDGIEIMIIGDGADYVFGGMDGLLAKDWCYDEFVNRFIYINPNDVLTESSDILQIFEQYRLPGNKIDFLKIMDTITIDESYSSYKNAFETADLQYLDPYEILKMKNALDLERIRNGESKYLIRELFRIKYPEFDVPNKNPMPRPVDFYFADWAGPTRKEFKPNLDITKFTGNQKWLIWCLEQFLNEIEN